MRILLEAYGCALNRGEAEELTYSLSAKGHLVIPGGEEFDLAVIFTCVVIDTTEQKMLKRIAQLARDNKRILVCGCLGAVCRENVLELAPDAIIFHPASNSEILTAIESLATTVEIGGGGHQEKRGAVGIVPIATGCLGQCSYCITRLARGKLRSRPPNYIIKHATGLVRSGVAELQITAQDTATYGMDMDAGPRLPQLMRAINDIEGDFMARVGMMNPVHVLEILDELAAAYSLEKIFKFIHLPVQSGSDVVLEFMNRGHLACDFERIVRVLRGKNPDIVISTDIITGFPGETDDRFDESLELIKRIEPDIVNVTRFSAREGTSATMMENQIPGWKSKDRSRLLTDLRFDISRKKFSVFTGMEVRALATEYRKPGTTFLRTQNYRPVVITGELELGKWQNLEITGYKDTHLKGRVVRDS